MKKWILILVALAAIMAVAIPGAVAADGVSADIELQSGWNLVSVPLVPDSTDPAVVFPGCTVYWWDAVAKCYLQAPIDPCKGYWVFSTSHQVITVTGEPYSG